MGVKLVIASGHGIIYIYIFHDLRAPISEKEINKSQLRAISDILVRLAQQYLY